MSDEPINHAAKALKGRTIWASTWSKAWSEAALAAGRAENRDAARKAWTTAIIIARDTIPAEMDDAASQKAWTEAWAAGLAAAEVLLDDVGPVDKPAAEKTEENRSSSKVVKLPSAWADEWTKIWAAALESASAKLKEFESSDKATLPPAGMRVLMQEWDIARKEADIAALAAAERAAVAVLTERLHKWSQSSPAKSDSSGGTQRSDLGRDAGCEAWKAAYRSSISS